VWPGVLAAILAVVDAGCSNVGYGFRLTRLRRRPRGRDVMDIKVLGSGCANCKRLHAETATAIAEAGVAATLSKVEAMEEIVAYGVMRTPALVIDGRVVSQGTIPSAREIVPLITTAAGRSAS
jgi:small redox-active disulfide protein 2